MGNVVFLNFAKNHTFVTKEAPIPENTLERSIVAAKEVGLATHLDAVLHIVEHHVLLGLLEETMGNVTRAADLAKLERCNFHRLMRKHGIRAEYFRR
jgi:transcriptional regulator of acetoin/glycerol metabolism